MHLLVIGFDEAETRELSRLFRAEGHAVLGAQGRHGARTFIHAVTPDAVIVPEGDRGAVAAGWLADFALDRPFVATPGDGRAVLALARALGLAPPEPEPSPDAQAGEGLSQAHAGSDDRGDNDGDDDDDEGDTDDGDDDWPREIRVEAEVVAPPLPEKQRRTTTRRTRERDDGPLGPEGVENTDTPAPRRLGSASPPPPEVPPPDPHPELASKLAQVRLGDYFSILEVEPNASTWAIREAFERLGRRFTPRGWPHRLHPVELEAIDEISRGLADALMVLGDDELRMRYQRALAAAAQGLDPSNPAR